MQVLLALAAYNEEERLPRVLERFARQAQAGGWRAWRRAATWSSPRATGAAPPLWV